MEPLRREPSITRENPTWHVDAESRTNASYTAASRHDNNDRQSLRGDAREDTNSEPTWTSDKSIESLLSKTIDNSDGDCLQRAWSHVYLWLPECLWCIASIAIFGTIIGVLAWRNNKPLPSWYGDLTVNTVVALLATACRAVTIIPVSEGISQLKWNWLAKRTRPLKDLQMFDEASRGPWGSLCLVFTARGQLLTVLAALVLTTGLATSTLTQSVIALETRHFSLLNGTATTSRLISTPADLRLRPYIGYQSNFKDDIVRAGWQAMLGPLGRVSPTPTQPTCSTSECRWQSFNSLGVCMSLHNATDRLLIEATNNTLERTYRASLFNDTYLDARLPASSVMRDRGGANVAIDISAPFTVRLERRYPRTTTFENEHDLSDTTFAYFSFIIFELGNWMTARFHAFERLWHFCTLSHEWTVTEGEPILRTRSHTAIIGRGGERQHASNDTTYIILSSGDKRENFTVRRNNTNLYNMFSADFEDMAGGGPSRSNEKLWTFIRARIDYNLSRTKNDRVLEEDIGQKLQRNLEVMGNSVATGISNVFLEYGEQVQGSALAPIVCIKVNWRWLSFLAAQILLTVIFLIAVIVQTALLGVEVVKSSAMATLFAINYHGGLHLQDGTREVMLLGLRQSVDKRVMGHL